MIKDEIRKKAMRKMLVAEDRITKSMIDFIKAIPEKRDKRYSELLSIERKKLKLIDRLRKVV